ncbi:MAG: hypothetical protein AB8I08_06420 [Sandaracinaceae bacterium]
MSQEDYNDLLNGAVEHATDLLQAGSEFAPFALAMQREDREIFHLEPEGGDPDQDAETTLGELRGGLREDHRRWRGVAIVADVTLEDDDGELITAAIHCAMEHADGEPVTCIVPYSIDDDVVELGELAMEPGDTIVFAVQNEA